MNWDETVTIATEVEVSVEGVLQELDNEVFINEIVRRGAIEEALSYFDIETIEDWLLANGGYNFEKVTTEQLQSELIKRDAPPVVPDTVLKALKAVNEFLTPKPVEGKRAFVDVPTPNSQYTHA